MSIIPAVLTLLIAGMFLAVGWTIFRSLPIIMTEYGFSEKELTIW